MLQGLFFFFFLLSILEKSQDVVRNHADFKVQNREICSKSKRLQSIPALFTLNIVSIDCFY